MANAEINDIATKRNALPTDRIEAQAAGGGASADVPAWSLGGISPVVTVTTNTVLTIANRVVLVDASAGNVTLTLPAANASGAGYSQSLRIKRIDGSANTVTVQRAGSDTVDDGTSTTISGWQSKDFNGNGVSLWGIC